MRSNEVPDGRRRVRDAADTRGIVSPGRMFRTVHLARYPVEVGDPLEGLVDWFWSVRWKLDDGQTHRQDVVSQPGVNVSVGNPPPSGAHPPPGPYTLRSVVNGVSTAVSTRVLSGSGWNLAAKTTTGGFGAWVDDVAALTDRVLPLREVLLIDGDVLVRRIARTCGGLRSPVDGPAALPGPSDLLAASDELGAKLAGLLEKRPAPRVELAREVGRVAGAAERDRGVRSLEALATLAGVTPRTLQRMFNSCAGVSPTWVIRRARLLDAAELVRDGGEVDWAQVAADLGYSDQPHLTRDFTAAIGVSPAAYAKVQREVPYFPLRLSATREQA